MILSAIAQSCLWAILGLGIFMTFRILNFPDMTTEGSFPLGGAVTVTALTHGFSPLIATLFGVLAGMGAGLVTGLLYTKGKIPTLLSGILVMTACNSVMLFVMGRANLSLLGKPKLQEAFSFISDDNLQAILLGGISLVIVISFLYSFFRTDLGQSYIATGDNKAMAKSFGINTDRMELLGLVLSNGIIALSGALIAQNDGYADITKGVGVIVIGLASIIIAEVFFAHQVTMFERLITIIIGSIVYQLLILFVIKVGLNTNYLKLFSSIILAICLMIPELRKRFLVRGSK
jgi:putative ABC transport system permease protein